MIQWFYSLNNIYVSELKGQVPDDTQLKRLFDISKKYLNEINDIISNEIEQWKTEFQSFIKQAELRSKEEEKK